MRYNIFNLIHKGLRASLYTTALQLQQTDFAREDEAEEAISKVMEIVMLFDLHASKEDKFVLPAISEYEPSVVATFEAEHATDKQLGEQLNNCLSKVKRAISSTDKTIAGRKLTEAFTEFMTFNLQHMAKEESLLNKILWQYYADDEIRGISVQIVQSTPPYLQDFYSTWMLRGINNTEATRWMKTLRIAMPEIVFQTIYTKAKQELSPVRFRKLAASLKEETVFA